MGKKRAANTKVIQRARFMRGTDIPVTRLLAVGSPQGGSKKRFVWAVKEDDGAFKHVPASVTELR